MMKEGLIGATDEATGEKKNLERHLYILQGILFFVTHPVYVRIGCLFFNLWLDCGVMPRSLWSFV